MKLDGKQKGEKMEKENIKKYILLFVMELATILLYFLFWKSGLNHYSQPYHKLFFAIYLMLMLLSMLGIGWWWLCGVGKIKSTFEGRFAVMLILAGIMINLVLPAFSAPDEGMHFASAYRISNILMGENLEDDEGHIYIRKEDRKAQVLHYSRDDYAAYYKSLFAKTGSEKMVCYKKYLPEKTLPFTTYIFPALGITIARILHLNGRWLMILARMFSFLFFCGAAVLSLKWIPYGKRVIMVLCLMPITVELVSSTSYDGSNLAFLLLYVSFVMHCAFDKESVTWKDILWLAVLGCCFAPIKLVYIPFLFLVFFIPKEKMFIGWKKAVGVLVLLLPVLESVIMKTGKIAFIASDTTHLTVEQGYSLGFLLHHPLHSLYFIVYSMSIKRGDETLDSFMGKSLGWLDVKIPRHFLMIFLFLLVLYALGEQGKIIFTMRQKCLAGTILGIGIILPILVMFLAETSVTATEVACVQGRYFLPLVLLLPIVAQSKKVSVQISEEPSFTEALLLYLNMLTVIFVLYEIWVM